MSNLVRHILGYTIGITMFLVVIPAGLYAVYACTINLMPVPIMHNAFLQGAIGLPLMFIGLSYMLWSNLYLFFVGKGGPADGFNVAISPRTRKLVTSGPYRYTRNPMVFGGHCLYFSLAIFWNSWPVLLVEAAFLAATIVYIKQTEEKRLMADFGKEFSDYKAKVAMIVPFVK